MAHSDVPHACDSAGERECSRTKTNRVSTNGLGTPLWMAPEVIARETYNNSADVYSYGIMLWEIASQVLPWDNELPDGPFLLNRLLVMIREERRPAVDAAWPAAYTDVMRLCWATVPAARPSCASVVAMLDAAPK